MHGEYYYPLHAWTQPIISLNIRLYFESFSPLDKNESQIYFRKLLRRDTSCASTLSTSSRLLRRETSKNLETHPVIVYWLTRISKISLFHPHPTQPTSKFSLTACPCHEHSNYASVSFYILYSTKTKFP